MRILDKTDETKKGSIDKSVDEWVERQVSEFRNRLITEVGRVRAEDMIRPIYRGVQSDDSSRRFYAEVARKVIDALADADPNSGNQSWKEEMLDKVDLIDAPEVGSILYPSSRRSAATVKYNRDKGYILGFCKKGSNKFLYPAFQFDDDKGVIRPEVKKGNELLDATYNPWAALSWWITPNSFIHDKLSPIELVEANDLDESEVEELIQIQFGGQKDQ